MSQSKDVIFEDPDMMVVVDNTTGTKDDIRTPVLISDLVASSENGEVPCWGCKYAFGPGSTQPSMMNLYQVYETAKRTNSLQGIYEKVSVAHFEMFCKPFLDSSPEVWSVSEVETHLLHHSNDPYMNDIVLIKRMKVLESAITDSILDKDSFGTMGVKEKRVEAMLKVVKMRSDAELRVITYNK